MRGAKAMLRPYFGRPRAAPELELPIVRKLLNGHDLGIVDVGARGGPHGGYSRLAGMSTWYAVEPDGQSALEIERDSRWSRVVLIREAISSSSSPRTIHITRQPGLSSLLLPNRDVVDRYWSGGEFDVVASTEVPVLTLDEAADRYGFFDACFVKLDTQGSELDILRSGARLLSHSVLGVQVEAEFQPLYQEQPLFRDVDSYLNDLGFSLFDLQRMAVRRATPVRGYSRRQVVAAHALYFRQNVADLPRGPIESALRLIALAVAYEHYDFAADVARGPALESLPAPDRHELTAEIELLSLARGRAFRHNWRYVRPAAAAPQFAWKDRDWNWH